MKEIIYYDEMCIPNQIRIVSEALCLDHTFSPAASQKIIGYKALLVLLRNSLIDSVYLTDLAKLRSFSCGDECPALFLQFFVISDEFSKK